MTSKTQGDVIRSEGLRKMISRRRFLALCGGAAATLVIASCTDQDAEPEVDQVTLTEGQIPVSGGDPLYSDAGRFYLINNENELLALYTKCTHQGCTVEWESDRQRFACPCHGSKFDRNGVRTDGPAKRPLDLMAIRTEPDGRLIIDTGNITERKQ